MPRNIMPNRLAERKAICELVRGGVTIAKAANQYNCSIERVYSACREFGLSEYPTDRKPTIAEVCNVISKLQQTEENLAEIAAAMGMQYARIAHIYQQAKLAGVEMQPRSKGRPKKDG